MYPIVVHPAGARHEILYARAGSHLCVLPNSAWSDRSRRQKITRQTSAQVCGSTWNWETRICAEEKINKLESKPSGINGDMQIKSYNDVVQDLRPSCIPWSRSRVLTFFFFKITCSDPGLVPAGREPNQPWCAVFHAWRKRMMFQNLVAKLWSAKYSPDYGKFVHCSA